VRLSSVVIGEGFEVEGKRIFLVLGIYVVVNCAKILVLESEKSNIVVFEVVFSFQDEIVVGVTYFDIFERTCL